MSVAKKEEVCSHRLGLRLGEPAVGVPIKKRPVLLSDNSVPSGMTLSMQPSSPTAGMFIPASEAGSSRDPFLSRSKSDTNVTPNFNGITSSWGQHNATISFAPSSMGSSEFPSCGQSSTGRGAPVVRSQSQKHLTLDLQLTSRQNAETNHLSLGIKDKVGQGFSVFPSEEPPTDVQTTSGMKFSSNSSFRELPSLDLNVALDPVDHHEGLPAMHEGGNRFQHKTVQQQKAHVPSVAPVSTISSGLSLNVDSTLNLSNAFGLSNKRGGADVTLDLQLKPPTRPELGISWKGLAPDPELSLSLSGKHLDEPKNPVVPDAIFKSAPAVSLTNISVEVATPGSEKSPVGKIAKPHQTMPSSVSANVEIKSSSLVKKEPEEPLQQHIQNNIKHTPLFEQQSVGLVSTSAELEKTDSTDHVLSKAGLDLSFQKLPNNSLHNRLEPVTDSIPVRADRLRDVVCTETIHVVSDVQKPIKCEQIEIPCPVVAATSGQSTPSVAKLLPLEGSVAIPAVGICEPIITLESLCYNPNEATIDCKPTVSHIHAHGDVTCKPSDAKEACDINRSSSNPTPESLVVNSRDHAAFDGLSQGSASMDCSDDGDNAISRLPTTNKARVESLRNSQITEANNLRTELQKEHDTAMLHDRSSMAVQVRILGVDDEKLVNTKYSTATDSVEEGHQSEISVNEKFTDKQLLTSDRSSPANGTDVAKQDVEMKTGFTSTDLSSSAALGTAASPKIGSAGKSDMTIDKCLEKSRSLVIESKRGLSPHGKNSANCSEGNAKIVNVKTEQETEDEETVKVSNLDTRGSVQCKDSHLDVASDSQPDSQPHIECAKVKSACKRSELEKSQPDSCMTSSVQNEKKDGQVDASHWRDVSNAHVNRNERWERFMQSEREKKGDFQGGRHSYDMLNQRRVDHRYGGRGGGYHGHSRNFRGPRMHDESENAFADEPNIGRRRPFEDDHGHLQRGTHRRCRSPPIDNQVPGHFMRDNPDRFSGRDISDPRQMDDLPNDMLEERYFIPHSHPKHALGDHAFIHRERSHSPGHRRGAPMHFHRGRSPEAMHRSPPLTRTDRSYLPHQRQTQRRSPFDRIEHNERGMPRNMRRCGMHQAGEDDTFEPPLHPAQLSDLHAEAELTERRKFGERRAHRRPLEESSVSDEEEMPSYHGEGDMDFAEGDGGRREPDGRLRKRLEHRAKGEQEDGFRYRGSQGWRDGNSNDSRPKRRRY